MTGDIRISKKELINTLGVPRSSFYDFIKVAENHPDYQEDCTLDYQRKGLNKYQVWVICQLIKEKRGVNKKFLSSALSSESYLSLKLSKVSWQEFRQNKKHITKQTA